MYLIGITAVELSPHRVLVLWATIEGPGAERFETGLGRREDGVEEEGSIRLGGNSAHARELDTHMLSIDAYFCKITTCTDGCSPLVTRLQRDGTKHQFVRGFWRNIRRLRTSHPKQSNTEIFPRSSTIIAVQHARLAEALRLTDDARVVPCVQPVPQKYNYYSRKSSYFVQQKRIN